MKHKLSGHASCCQVFLLMTPNTMQIFPWNRNPHTVLPPPSISLRHPFIFIFQCSNPVVTQTVKRLHQSETGSDGKRKNRGFGVLSWPLGFIKKWTDAEAWCWTINLRKRKCVMNLPLTGFPAVKRILTAILVFYFVSLLLYVRPECSMDAMSAALHRS